MCPPAASRVYTKSGLDLWIAWRACAKMAADLVKKCRCPSRFWPRLKGASLPRRRGHVNGTFGLTSRMPSCGAPRGMIRWGHPIREGPMENWSAKPIPAASPVRHRGRDDGYGMMPSLSVCSSAHGASPEADESCIAPMLDRKSVSNASTAQRWRKASAAAQGTS
jgi:hypothetical protein